MEKFLQNIINAKKQAIQTNYLIATNPLIKDKQILIKILKNSGEILTKSINSILIYENSTGKISLTKNPKENLKKFEKCKKDYFISDEEIQKIKELFFILKLQKSAPMEVLKQNTLIIFSEKMEKKVISFPEILNYFNLSNIILKKTAKKIIKY